MAITSQGYDGSIQETEWARMAPRIGVPYWVASTDDLAASINTSLDRAIDISGGDFGGSGVMDHMDSTETLQFDPVASGWRYDLVVAERNWQGVGGQTSLRVIKGGSRRQIPPFSRNPGALDDQLLYLIPIQAGRARVDGIIDLRGFGVNGNVIVMDPLAMEGYNNWPGLHVQVGREVYTLQVDRTWVRTGLISASTPGYRFRVRHRQTLPQGEGTTIGPGWTRSGDNSMGMKILPDGRLQVTKAGQYAISANMWSDTTYNQVEGSAVFRLNGLWVQPDAEHHKNSWPKGFNIELSWFGTLVTGDIIEVWASEWNRQNRRMTFNYEINIEMVG